MGFLVVLVMLFGAIPGFIAHAKGHSFVKWWIFGMLLFIVALPWACLLRERRPRDFERRRREVGEGWCPYCEEPIDLDERACRDCARDILGATWKADPLKRHEFRYWDGVEWTPQVSDDGVISVDPT